MGYSEGVDPEHPLIPRMQLSEFDDQPWLPNALRRLEVDYLRGVLELAVLLKLADGLGGDDYLRESGVMGSGSTQVTWLTGRPRKDP